MTPVRTRAEAVPARWAMTTSVSRRSPTTAIRQALLRGQAAHTRQPGLDDERRRLASHQLYLFARAALNGPDDGRRVGDLAPFDRAGAVGVGGYQTCPSPDGLEGGVQFAIIEGAVEGGHDEVRLLAVLGLVGDLEAKGGQLSQQRRLADDEHSRTGGLGSEPAAQHVSGGEHVGGVGGDAQAGEQPCFRPSA